MVNVNDNKLTDSKKDSYSMKELMEITGFGRRTIRFYVQKSLIEPPLGRGLKGLYSKKTLQTLLKIKEMKQSNITLRGMGDILNLNNSTAKVAEKTKKKYKHASFKRSVEVRYNIADGLSLLVDSDFEIRNEKKIIDILSLIKNMADYKK